MLLIEEYVLEGSSQEPASRSILRACRVYVAKVFDKTPKKIKNVQEHFQCALF